MILDSDTIPEDRRLQAAKAAESRGVKQIKVNLDAMEDVAVLMELARLKSMSLKPCP
jgi:predicted kinase